MGRPTRRRGPRWPGATAGTGAASVGGPVYAAAVTWLVAIWLVGCATPEADPAPKGSADTGTPEEAPPAPPCATVDDGVCDELSTCALGTDPADCAAHCDGAAVEDPICAHQVAAALQDAPAEAVSRRSGGEGGPVGTWDGTVDVRGSASGSTVTRHYRVYAPRSLPPDGAAPLLFVLGGFTVDAYWLAEYTEIDRAADLNDMIVVYGHPEWRDFGSAWVFSWYVYEAAYVGRWEDNPDLAYLEAVLEEVGTLYDVDLDRVYVSGHSRGAALSIIAATERPDLFAGFCAQAGFVGANAYDERIDERMEEEDLRLRGVLVHGTDDRDVRVGNSDDILEQLEGYDHVEGEDLLYYRLSRTGHEWQPQYNQQMLDFLMQRDP